MKQTRNIVLTLAMMVLFAVGLYACGGESPTNTPVPPPTSTTAPTQPPVPTATTQAETSGGGSGTSTGTKATDAELATIKAAVDQAKDLKSYHFNIEMKPSDFITQPVKAEGDYVAPDTAYIKGSIGSEKIEQIVVGETVFVKDASGKWVVKKEETTNPGDPTASFNPEQITSSGNPLGGLGETFKEIKTYYNEGTETMDGVKVTKYSFKLDFAEMMGSEPVPEGMNLSNLDLGGGALWVDTSAKNLHKIDLNLNLGPIMEMIAQAFSGMMGTPTPGGPQPTPMPKLAVNMIMTISKHNDPSIKIPVTDEMRQQATQAAEPTPEATTEDTPEPSADETPEAMATAEETAGETPEAMPTTASGSGTEVKVDVGSTASLGGINMTVNKVTRSDSGNLSPSAGNEYVILNITVENTDKEDKNISSLLQFKLVDSAGAEQQQAFGAKIEFIDSVLSGPLAPGKSATGEIAYEVKKGTSGLVLEFSPDPFFNEKDKVLVNIGQ